jgi:DNA modification methylase
MRLSKLILIFVFIIIVTAVIALSIGTVYLAYDYYRDYVEFEKAMKQREDEEAQRKMQKRLQNAANQALNDALKNDPNFPPPPLFP